MYNTRNLRGIGGDKMSSFETNYSLVSPYLNLLSMLGIIVFSIFGITVVVTAIRVIVNRIICELVGHDYLALLEEDIISVDDTGINE